jgi:integrase
MSFFASLERLTFYTVSVSLVKKQVNVTSPWLHPLIILALNTGLQQGELLGLKWSDASVLTQKFADKIGL